MRPRNNRSIVYSFLWEIGHSPHRIVQFLQFILLGWLLLLTLFGFGGFIPHGQSMIGISKAMLLLTGVHALSIAFGRNRPGLEWELILPLPFLLYAWFHYQFLSPAPWTSAPFLAVLVQAYALYFLVFNSIHSMRSGRWVLSICQIFVGFALLAGFFQFYLFPDWMPEAQRLRNPDYAAGASGFLQDPANLGALLIAFFPVFAVLTAKYLRSGPAWIFQGFFAFVILVGLLVTVNLTGLVAVAVLLLLLPFFLSDNWRRRRQLWLVGGLVLSVFGFGIWFGTDDLQERVVFFLNPPVDDLAGMSRSVALSQFLENPIFGQGLATFHSSWFMFLPDPVLGTSYYAVSSLRALLAETGVTGFLLAGLPVLYLLKRGFSEWRAIPFIHLNRDDSERLSKMSRRNRRRTMRTWGRMPYQKAVLAGTCLGIIALVVYCGWDYFLQLPLGLYIFACLAGILAGFCRDLQRPAAQGKFWLVTACLPFLLSLWAAIFGLPRFYAEYLNYTASEHLSHLQADPNLIFLDPGALSLVEAKFQGAVDLVPNHGEAWTGLASARLTHLYTDLESPQQIAESALPYNEKAVEFDTLSWLAHYNLARTRLILGAQPSVVDPLLDKAMELAPFRPETIALKGSLLLLRENQSSEGLLLLEKALALAPGYEPAERAFRRGRFRQGGLAEGSEGLPQGLMSEAILAQQFRPIPQTQERVLGAGLPVIVDFIPVLPEAAE